MNQLQLVLVLAIPATGLLALWALLNRWGKNRDPMGGSAKDLWSTTGTQSRSESDQD
jgi:hypothetical protein